MLKVEIREIRDEAEGVRSLLLTPVEGQTLPAFEAGAHIDLNLPSGKIRQYSLYNGPQETDGYRIAVLREAEGQGGSIEIHDQLKQGDQIEISEPRNLFALKPTSGHSLLVAGGIGITPILSMARQLAAEGKPFDLHYCARRREQAAFADWLEQSEFADQVHLHLSQEADSSRMDATQVLANPGSDDQLYVCGSPAFIDQMLETASVQGWPSINLHREYFTAEEPTPQDGDQAFEILVGEKLVKVAADETAAAALEKAGFILPLSCEKGVCGSCLTTVVDGQPDHRDLYLTEEEQAENKMFTPCCSRSRSARLVLDLDNPPAL